MLLIHIKCESESHLAVSVSLQPLGLYSPWNSPGQNTGVGSCSLLEGIFPTQGWNHVSCGSRIAAGFLITKPLGKANVGNWESELKNAVKVKVGQSCPTLCDPLDYTVYRVLQARILEWVAVPFSSRSSQLRNLTQIFPTLRSEEHTSELQSQ